MIEPVHRLLMPAGAGLVGWKALLPDKDYFARPGAFPLYAYSEFMPPPYLGISPYGTLEAGLFEEDDPFGWYISEIEEEYQLKPGLQHLAVEIMHKLYRLGSGQSAEHIAGKKHANLTGNPYWPADLSARAGQLTHERYVMLLPLALSRTQDDFGRVSWTFFGGSEQGPEQAFWKSFFTAPGQEIAGAEGLSFFYRLLQQVYGIQTGTPEALLQAGFRILPGSRPDQPWREASLPAFTRPYQVQDGSDFGGVRCLLTFRPFADLPAPLRQAYLDGRLHLLPFPGSLVFWGMPPYLRLNQELPLALQIPLLHLVGRHGGPHGIHVPQSGWFFDHPDPQAVPDIHADLRLDTFARTNRWDRRPRYENELELNLRLDTMGRVLFSNELRIMGLYDKPMAPNVQLWNEHYEVLLDGPRDSPQKIRQTEEQVVDRGLFGYRFQFPAMRVGPYEVYWQRPLVAWLPEGAQEPRLFDAAPLGYLTAYLFARPDPAQPIELWPRLRRRPEYLAALVDVTPEGDHFTHQTSLNIAALFESWELLGREPLPRSLARRLLRIRKEEELDEWLALLPRKIADPQEEHTLAGAIRKRLAPAGQPESLPQPLTFAFTADRRYEEAYWNDIAMLAQGEFTNKDNADPVLDDVTKSKLKYNHRDLERLGDALIERHRQSIQAAGLQGQALVGEFKFHWKTIFDFPQYDGWLKNQAGPDSECDILVVIPGKDRSQAVILADHYDAAYEEDTYRDDKAHLSAAGADDNCSATATLLQAAPIYLELARQGKLERDIWLLHLTGEEFPADCLGARHFCQALVEKTLIIHLPEGEPVDLSGVQIAGLYVMDMIAHNRDNAQDIFQISPGKGAACLRLALVAHQANLVWNAHAHQGNQLPERKGLGRGKRSADSQTMPDMAAFLPLIGEVRTHLDPHSSLYNTDGQIFSDAGVPVVLFMENYDINRHGYHDTQDTLANIDLDYGAALSAIAIETVAQMAARVK